MSYREKDFTVLFNHFLKEVWRKTGAFELKISHTDSIPFSVLAPHQEEALLHAENDCVSYKIPDTGFQTPFDCFSLCNATAFVVVMFEAKSDRFFMIPIDKWIKEGETSERKSITAKRASEIGIKITI